MKQTAFEFLASSPVAVKLKPSRATLQLIRAMNQVRKVVARTTASQPAQQGLVEVCR
jgi:hypothetical protein